MICSSCGKTVTASAGKYVYYHGKLLFACKPCAKRMNEETKCARTVCATIDRKRSLAEYTINNPVAFEEFLKSIDAALRKIPDIGSLLSDIPFLVSLVKSYVADEYTEIPRSTIVAVVGALLYVISPFDMIPDVIPGVGYTDDAMVVSFCIKLFQEELERYRIWREKRSLHIGQ